MISGLFCLFLAEISALPAEGSLPTPSTDAAEAPKTACSNTELALTRAKAALALQKKDPQSAKAAFDACPAPDDALFLITEAQIALNTGDLALAEKKAQAAVKKNPKSPQNVILLCQLAEIQLKAGKPLQAARTLNRAKALDPQNDRVDYLSGLAALRAGEFEIAKTQFEALPADSALKNRAQAQLAIAALEAGQPEDALTRFEALDFDALPADFDADGWYEAAKHQMGRSQRGFSVQGHARALYDTNVSQLFSDASEERLDDAAAFGSSFALGLQATPFAGASWALSGAADVSRTDYFSETTDDFSNIAVAANLGFQKRFKLSSGDFRLQTRYLFALTYLQGGEQTTPSEGHMFSERHQGELAAEFEPSDRLRLRAYYRGGLSRYADLRRDATHHEFRFSTQGAFLDKRLKVMGQLGYRYEEARGEGFTRHAPTVILGLSGILPYQVQASLILQGEFGFHPDSLGYYGWEDERKDRIWSLDATLSHTLGFSWLSMELNARFTDHGSSVSRFDYARAIYTLGLNAQYGG